jgi:hypothetical protein
LPPDEQMTASTIPVSETGQSQKPRGFLTWTATILACGYFAWAGIALHRLTGIFAQMYASMGVDLPTSTKIVIASYGAMYPLVFGASIGLVIAKQYWVRDLWLNLCITLSGVVVVELWTKAIMTSLYHPLFALTEKLSK